MLVAKQSPPGYFLGVNEPSRQTVGTPGILNVWLNKLALAHSGSAFALRRSLLSYSTQLDKPGAKAALNSHIDEAIHFNQKCGFLHTSPPFRGYFLMYFDLPKGTISNELSSF